MRVLLRSLLGAAAALLLTCAGIPAAGAAPAAFRTYYVDCANGDDAAPGTDESHPWRTPARASSVTYEARDRVLFRRGTTCAGPFAPKGSGTAVAPVTVDAYGSGAKPGIVGDGSLAAVLLRNVEGWEIRDLDVSNPGPPPGPGTLRYGVLVELEDHGTGHHYVVENVDVHDVEGCDCQERHTPGSSAGIAVRAAGSTTPTAVDDVLIRANTVRRVGPEGIATQSEWQHRPEYPMGRGTRYVPLTGVRILGNTVDTVSGDGILAFNTSGAHVAFNTVRNFGAATALYRSGIASGNADGSVVESNTVTDAHGPLASIAYDIDHASNGSVFQYNFSRDVNGGALFACNSPGEKADRNVFRFNISQNDGYADKNGFGVVFLPCGPARDVAVYGNTFYAPGSRLLVAAPGTVSVEFSDNIFVGRPGGSAVEDTHGVYRNNLYRSVVAVPAGDPRPVTGDPLLVAPGTATGPDDAQGYRLRAGSPALHAGAAMTNPGWHDFFGNLLPPFAPNQGAYQGEGVTAG
ncbi:right-handed parallel beta-helix repeat-containing protein [Streptomyces caatingaensis]|uniref:Uncharacterized protein n=1 Tax=Streptomyces caatingaensis TaxID=1678637 RepID=A0A0K9XB75_9ACTN|nr:right-handed parallel beta-helix repeat-containing protein [Streptomyces caatingaensis]KNB49912.1 hypothetical protein AC230_24540 [Streptomyces caatingaensis]